MYNGEAGTSHVRAQIRGLSYTRDGEAVLTIYTREDIAPLYDELCGTDADVTIKKFRKKRSLDANSYFWVLAGKLAEKTHVPLQEIYRETIRNIGGNYDIVCVKKCAADKLRDIWHSRGIGWISDVMPSKIHGCVNVVLYYGSSAYDTAQMSRLIDIIVQDCKTAGIETLPPDKLAAMARGWGAKGAKSVNGA